MDLEYLLVGIARENENDFESFYNETRVGTYVTALSILGDRQLARDAAVEAYRRVKKLAYKFDTDMSAEYWVTDLVKNICMNGLCDGEIAAKAGGKLRDNITLLAKNALFESEEDRGRIIAAKLGTNLKMGQVADLLWYTKFSARGEYRRGVQKAGSECGMKSVRDAEEQLRRDFAEMTPEYFGFVRDEGYKTAFSNISEANLFMTEQDRANPGETQDARKARVEADKAKKKKKKIITAAIIAACVLIAAAVVLIVHFVNKADTKLKEDEQYSVGTPLYGAGVAMIEQNGRIYYENRKDGAKLYVYDKATGKSTKLSDADPKDFAAVGENIYFRNSSNGCLSFIDTASGKVTESVVKGSLPEALGDKIVYSSSQGVSVIDRSLDPETAEVIYTADVSEYRCDIETDEKGTVYFSAAPSEGFYRLTPVEDGSYYRDISMEGYAIYDFEVINGYLMFENTTGDLYLVNLGETQGENLITLPKVLKTAAFCVDNGIIYYSGEGGIYAVSFEDARIGQMGEKVLDLSGQKYDVGDLHVSGDDILCYFSNGEKKKPHNELVLYKKGENGSGTTLFRLN